MTTELEEHFLIMKIVQLTMEDLLQSVNKLNIERITTQDFGLICIDVKSSNAINVKIYFKQDRCFVFDYNAQTDDFGPIRLETIIKEKLQTIIKIMF